MDMLTERARAWPGDRLRVRCSTPASGMQRGTASIKRRPLARRQGPSLMVLAICVVSRSWTQAPSLNISTGRRESGQDDDLRTGM